MRTLEEKLVDKKTINRKTWISIACFVLFIAASVFAWKWITRPSDTANGSSKPLRFVLDKNEEIFSTIFSDGHISKKFSKKDAVKQVRVNGDYGLGNGFDAASWKLKVVRKPGDTLFIGMDEIKALPKTDVIFDFKCIEGWSQVTHWAGVKFSDFVKKYGLDEQAQMSYVGMETPDQQYYVGIDKKSILHPQTILCYEMNEQPLPLNQGAPLRLIIPVKYGVKHIKRIGTLFFSNERPRDYWFERGYDYYCGL